MKEIVLASASPRRRELLKLLGIEFISITTHADETPLQNESAPAMVERLARLKEEAAQARAPGPLVIAADTDVELVVLGRAQILGKPRDAAEAREMLTALRNRAHSVYTGLVVADQESRDTEIVHSRVWMRAFSDAEMDAYIATGDPLDKAAGYAVQHQGFQPVARVEGCFANVMGLPLCRLYHALARHTDLPTPALECIEHPEENCSVEKAINPK
jgi:nucleoside triphosphate pyrophosphatase